MDEYHAALKRQVSDDVDLFGNMIDNGYDAEAEAMAAAAVSMQREEMLRRNIIENAKKQGRMQAISKQFGITVSVKFDDETDADRQLKASILKIEKLKEWYLHADIIQEIRKRAGYVVDADAVLEAEQKDDDNKFNEPYQDGLFSVRFEKIRGVQPGQKGWGDSDKSLRYEDALARGLKTADMIVKEYG